MVDYTIIKEPEIAGLIVRVCRCIDGGWETLGPPFETGGIWYQAMVKRDVRG
jgi:hypothetical protein